jgi:hypothetical protein
MLVAYLMPLSAPHTKTASNYKIINELEGIWKETAVAQFRCYPLICVEKQENHENPQSVQPVCAPGSS